MRGGVVGCLFFWLCPPLLHAQLYFASLKCGVWDAGEKFKKNPSHASPLRKKGENEYFAEGL
jgi:hypothetical protein